MLLSNSCLVLPAVVKQQQEEISRNHVPSLFAVSVGGLGQSHSGALAFLSLLVRSLHRRNCVLMSSHVSYFFDSLKTRGTPGNRALHGERVARATFPLFLSPFLLEILQPESKGRRRGRGQKGRLVLWLVQLELRGPWRREGGPVS